MISESINPVPMVLSYPPYGRERAGSREPWERGSIMGALMKQ